METHALGIMDVPNGEAHRVEFGLTLASAFIASAILLHSHLAGVKDLRKQNILFAKSFLRIQGILCTTQSYKFHMLTAQEYLLHGTIF
ncbi:uncharacterized protein LOC131062391 isoform X3 [Cryptomeria japonica]|uniref:uncharacterized protein LOC131062391 isoform X3 n=1 Tax=Cryptomeria japonica TaxID=3369 RepID=UPI0027DA7991|nr:uncharacterized protein LOC131062391 isoform X3 [Cryptomeria japonica]